MTPDIFINALNLLQQVVFYGVLIALGFLVIYVVLTAWKPKMRK